MNTKLTRRVFRPLMAALCCVPMALTAQNSVEVVSEASPMKYNPMIFGSFIEHFDNQIYGGIFDPESPLSDEDGFRKDVIEAIKDIKTPIIRWPGGCFVSVYHWVYGVGPERTPMFDKNWQVEDPNTFGTDEYIKWCRKVGCEPYICTNAGSGTPEEMSDWVEYCNLNVGKWGRMRIANGYKEPYNVKYWSVGNENWGGHELGARTIQEWGPMVRESAKMMRSVTNDAKLFAAATSDPYWTRPLLENAGYILDYISIHGYWDPIFHIHNPAPYLKCMMKTDYPEGDIKRTIDILKETGFGDGRIKIAFDEWNLRNWHHPWNGGDFRTPMDYEARRKNDIASIYTMADALFSACFLNTCMRYADYVDIACYSPIVNTRGLIFVHKDGIVKRSTYYVFKMYTNLLEEYVMPLRSEFEKLSYEDSETGMMDVILTTDEKKEKFAYAVVNKHPEKSIDLALDFDGLGMKAPKKVKATILSGRSCDDYNDIDRETVVPYESTLKVVDGKVAIPAHSLAIIKL